MLSRLRNGIYSLSYQVADGDTVSTSGGLVIVRANELHGSDPGGGVFNGTVASGSDGRPYIHGHIIVGANCELITGQKAGPSGLRVDFKAVPHNSTDDALVFAVDLAGSEIIVKADYVGALPAQLDKAPTP